MLLPYFTKSSLLFGLVLLLMGCANSSEQPAESSNIDIPLRWRAEQHWNEEENTTQCIFTLVNKSELTLGPDNWRLYFSTFPRTILQATHPLLASAEHVSGDWHRIQPESQFSLPPGDSIEIGYIMQGFLLKESDAALGPYLVLVDQKGVEGEAMQFSEYQIQPFDWPEKYRNHAPESIPMPWPELRYQANLNLAELEPSKTLPLIPSPVYSELSGDSCTIDLSWEMVYQPEVAKEAEQLKQNLQDLLGLELSSQVGSFKKNKHIFLGLDSTLGHESYHLNIQTDHIEILGGSASGVFYGMHSLLQLAPLANLQNSHSVLKLPNLHINDGPRFSYRGLHLDVCRNFQTKDEVMRIVDLMSHYKLNRLQLYLSEDEAWRLDIEELPELTGLGSQRGHTLDETTHLHPAYGSGPDTHRLPGSGYYTREEFKEILQYAQARHVEVIPTFGLPAHARAAIKAMEARRQRLLAAGDSIGAETYRLIDPEDKSVYVSAQGYHDNVVTVARPGPYRFYQAVIEDVEEMYQEAGVNLRMIHTGGDEIPVGAWSASPQNLALLDSLPNVQNPANLQTYFFETLLKRLNRPKLQIGAWEEVALEKNPSGHLDVSNRFANGQVVPYVWNTLGEALDLGYRLANTGYPIVFCNVQNLYFDLAYDSHPKESGLYWGGFVDTRAAWSFAPFDLVESLPENDPRRSRMTLLKPEAKKNILGLQAQVWSETIKGAQMLEYYLLPKLLGYAERAWSRGDWEESKLGQHLDSKELSWNRFANTLGQGSLARLSFLFGGYHYRVPPPGAVIKEGMLYSNVSFPGLSIHYTADGSVPNQESPIYEGPVSINGHIQLRAFDQAGKSSRTVQLAPSKVGRELRFED